MMALGLKAKAIIGLAGVIILTTLILLYGNSEYQRGVADTVSANLQAKTETQTSNSNIKRKADHVARSLADDQLDDAASHLGILRPDSAR